MILPKMLTIGELAKHFEGGGLSPYRIRQMVIRGEVPSIRAGKKYLVNLDRFVEYLNGPPVADPKTVRGIRRIEEYRN